MGSRHVQWCRTFGGIRDQRRQAVRFWTHPLAPRYNHHACQGHTSGCTCDVRTYFGEAAVMKWIEFVGCVFLSLAAPTFAQNAHITAPAEQFGFEPGADRKLADWTELTAYYQKVASQSDRVRYQELGKTMEGRPFVMLT